MTDREANLDERSACCSAEQCSCFYWPCCCEYRPDWRVDAPLVRNPYCCQELLCICNEPNGLSALFCAPCALWTYAGGADFFTRGSVYACPACKSDLCSCCSCPGCPTLKKCLYLASLAIPFVGCCRVALMHTSILNWVSSRSINTQFGDGVEAVPAHAIDRNRHQPFLIGFCCCPCVLPWHISVFGEALMEYNEPIMGGLVDGREEAADNFLCGLCGFPSWYGDTSCCQYKGIRSYPFGVGHQMQWLGPDLDAPKSPVSDIAVDDL